MELQLNGKTKKVFQQHISNHLKFIYNFMLYVVITYKSFPREDRLKEVGLVSLEKKGQQGGSIVAFQFQKEGCKKEGHTF